MNIVTRKEWGARKPKRSATIATPTPELWLHHTAGNEADGSRGMRQIQNFHMDGRGWADIAYSFVVDRNGVVYEGRGAGIAGAHTSGHNTISHAICVMGNYEKTPVPQVVIDAIADLVRWGHTQGWWPAKITGGHRQASGASTTCPGRNLLTLIDAINDKAKPAPNEEFFVEPIFYARRGTPDFDAACWAAAATGRGSASCDLNAVRAAASKGAAIVAVGGPASRDLEGSPHRAVTGADAIRTMSSVVDYLLKG